MNRKEFCLVIAVLILGTISASAQDKRLAEQIAGTAMNSLWHDAAKNHSSAPAKWSDEQGVVMKGMEGVWLNTADARYFRFIQESIDRFVQDDGTIRTYKGDDTTLTIFLTEECCFSCTTSRVRTSIARRLGYYAKQLKTHPRTSEGGFWHKKIYPSQMWLDGLYMGEPFYAEYAKTFHEDADFDDIARQFVFMERHSRDSKTGLLYHGWDESRKQRWSNSETGRSPNFWGRAMGWYAMAVVDTLDYFPENNPQRAELLQILKRLAVAVQHYQDSNSGFWYQVLDKAGEKGNYLEASAACMFTYALAKGVRKRLLTGELFRRGATRLSRDCFSLYQERSEWAGKSKGKCSVAGAGWQSLS